MRPLCDRWQCPNLLVRRRTRHLPSDSAVAVAADYWGAGACPVAGHGRHSTGDARSRGENEQQIPLWRLLLVLHGYAEPRSAGGHPFSRQASGKRSHYDAIRKRDTIQLLPPPPPTYKLTPSSSSYLHHSQDSISGINGRLLCLGKESREGPGHCHQRLRDLLAKGSIVRLHSPWSTGDLENGYASLGDAFRTCQWCSPKGQCTNDVWRRWSWGAGLIFIHLSRQLFMLHLQRRRPRPLLWGTKIN